MTQNLPAFPPSPDLRTCAHGGRPRLPGRRGRTALRALALFATGLLGSACSGVDAPAGPPRVGDQVPALDMITLAGETVNLSSYEGQPLLLNLWATWCPPCRAEMPYLQALYDEFSPRGLQMVGLSMDTPSAQPAVEAFIAESGVNYDILVDPQMAAMDAVAAVGLPVTLLVGHDGTIQVFRMGPIMEGDAAFEGSLEEVVAAYEAASSAPGAGAAAADGAGTAEAAGA